MSGHRYYIVFVDDYSRVSLVYLQDRLHVLDTVKYFFVELINQFSVTLKIFGIDNALEFIQIDLQYYLGILHQIFCVHTSQQNGVAERKYRHILDVARTIMLKMKVPKYLWSDAVLTTSFLINRMPSTPLGGEVPFRCLTSDTELFSLPPRVFRCVAFVKDLSLGLDKLSPKSIKCLCWLLQYTKRVPSVSSLKSQILCLCGCNLL